MHWIVDLILRGIEVVVVLGGVVGALYCGRLWLQVQKHRAIAEGKDELIKTMSSSSEAYKSLFESKSSELEKYRNEQHDRNDAATKTILRLTTENAELKSKTDLSPVTSVLTEFITEQRRFVKEQTAINEKLLSILANMETRIIGKSKGKLTARKRP